MRSRTENARRRIVALVWVTAVAVVSGLAAAGGTSRAGTGPGTVDLAAIAPAPFEAHGSVGQVWLTGAAPGQLLDLVAADGRVVRTQTANPNGAAIFRELAPARYRVATRGTDPVFVTRSVRVTREDEAPPASFYRSQPIGPGYGYLTTRDGTTLAINVTLPGPPENGPYPTLIEYSGYSPANSAAPQPSTLIANALGYATVGVNMRGTGCSGGAFQFFEPLQSTDGYDVVETIAVQPWVRHHKVGMIGISYPGISQLFVARLDPPHLAAIAPLSVIGDTARGTLAPGGIFNDGFALSWAEDRQHDAEAAPESGQAWAGDRIRNGDQQCAANQVLRDQAPKVLDMIAANRFWTDAVAAPLAPELFVHDIDVPVFLAGAWQDEQTGAYFANMIDDFTGTDRAWFTLVNGSHVDPLGPAIFARWTEFLSIYVAREVPRMPPIAAAVVAVVGREAFGTSDLVLPPERFGNVTDYYQARRIFERDPRVRVLFDNGAGRGPGVPAPAFEYGFSGWPVDGVHPTNFWFGPQGSLTRAHPDVQAADAYRYDTSHAHDRTIYGGDSAIWRPLPDWRWNPPEPGAALAYTSKPLRRDTVMVGGASADLWLRSTAPDTDVQVQLVEVRPDGNETYVQAGWLRASHRKLALGADRLRPLHTFTERDAKPLPSYKWASVRVEIFPFAHAFRAGSRIRVVIDSPGGTRPRWTFDVLPAGAEPAVNRVGRGGVYASRVVLPVVEGLEAPTPLPPCPSLRGQPCRPAATITNASAAP